VRVLLIEDDERLAERTAEYLRTHQATVDICGAGDEGLIEASKAAHDIILLDLMLPGLDGLELCKQLRQRSSVPVIMLSARGDEVDRIVGLEIGADDYLPKPFSPRELLARIRAVLRRHESASEGVREDRLTVGSLTMDRGRRQTNLGDRKCDLTAYQFDLLWVLASRAERVLSRAQLHSQVRELRGEAPQDFDPSVDRSIDVHLSKIRQAIADDTAHLSPAIKTVRGVGYVLSLEGG
jgi:DNA-binding response OmpR family regulator